MLLLLFLEISRSVRHPVLAAYIVNHGTSYPHERKCSQTWRPCPGHTVPDIQSAPAPLVYKLFLLQKGSGHGPQLHCRGTHNGKIVHNQPVSQFLAAVFLYSSRTRTVSSLSVCSISISCYLWLREIFPNACICILLSISLKDTTATLG